MKYKKISLMIALAFTAHQAYADADSTIDIPRVDVIGNQSEWFATSGSATVINKQELESSHVMTTNEALRKVPGLVLRDEEGFAMRPNIGIRGLNPTRSTKVLLLEDGIPLTYAPYGDNASYYYPTIDRFDSIEVLKGANQVKFGPQTMGGVINHITPNAPEKFGGHFSVTAGNRDYINTKIHVGGNGMLLDYTHKEGDGARDETHLNVEDVNFKITKAIGEAHALTLRANYFSEDSQVSYTGLTQAEYRNFGGEYNPFHHDGFKTKRYGASVTHDWQINNNAMLTTNVYYSYFDRDWWRQQSTSAQSIGDGAGPINEASCTALLNARLAGQATNGNTCLGDQGRLRTYNVFGVEPRLSVTHAWGQFDAGVKAHYENQKRRQINGGSAAAREGLLSEYNIRKTDAYSGFLSNKFDIGALSITPIMRYEHVMYERINRLNGVNGDAGLHEWIPGVSVAYTPHDALTVYGGVHRGFAPPRTEDLIGLNGGSVDVDAERSTNWELGFRSRPTAKSLLEMTGFYNDFSNLVAVGSVASNVNLSQGKATFAGLEVLGRYDFDHGVYTKLAYTWLPIAEQDQAFQRVDNHTLITGSGSDKRQPYAPKNTMTASLGYKVGDWDAQIEAVYVDKQYADFAETKTPSLDGQRGEIRGYTIYNAAVNYHYTPYRTTFFVTGKNIFDKNYIADRTRGILTGMPALIQVGAKYDF